MSSKNTVRKQIDLIVKAAYKLDLIEQRLILLGISAAVKKGKAYKDGDFITFTVQDYVDVFKDKDTKTKVHSLLKQALTSLGDKSFVLLNQVSPNTGYVRSESWTWLQAKANYKDHLGIIELVFSHKVYEHIQGLNHSFTLYPLERIAGMTSVYPIRLYEILIRWYNQGITEKDLSVEYLQELFALDNGYKLFGDFKRWVIDVAVKQINDHSDLTCSYTTKKTGRAVTHLLFKYDLKPEAKAEKAEQAAKPKPAVKRTTKAAVQSVAPNPYPTNPNVDTGRAAAQRKIEDTQRLFKEQEAKKASPEVAKKAMAEIRARKSAAGEAKA